MRSFSSLVHTALAAPSKHNRRVPLQHEVRARFFLATTYQPFSPSSVPLNADERKRHEFVDCQMIELIRMEILPYANQLPRDFMQRIIDILNRGSINTIDPNDVLGKGFTITCIPLHC